MAVGECEATSELAANSSVDPKGNRWTGLYAVNIALLSFGFMSTVLLPRIVDPFILVAWIHCRRGYISS